MYILLQYSFARKCKALKTTPLDITYLYFSNCSLISEALLSVFRCRVNICHWTQWRSGLFVSTVSGPGHMNWFSVVQMSYSRVPLCLISSWFHPVSFGAEQRRSSVVIVETGSAELHLPLSVQG